MVFGSTLEAVAAWLAQTHPKNKRFLTQDGVDVKPADWPRWARLWHLYIPEYVAATNEKP